MAYIYRHIRLDKNIPFYIGISFRNDNYFRAYQKSNSKRSKYWHNIAKNGYEVEIILDNITNEQAIEKEKEFIKLYGRLDNNTGILCNLTDGGDVPPIMYAENNPMKKIENRIKLSKIMTGKKKNYETRQKISQIKKLLGIKPPSRKGCKMSIESINKSVKTKMDKGCNRKIIYQYSKDKTLIKVWNYSQDILKYNKYSLGNIHSVCRNERKSAYGYIWSYNKY